MDRPFHGTGWGFPPTFSPELGGPLMATGVADIEQSLTVLLGTLPGERVMLPGFGASVRDLLFEAMDTGTQTEFLDRVQTAILRFEARIDILALRLNTDFLTEGRLLLELDWRPRSANSRFNFVYPFYLNEGSQVALP